MNTSYSLTDRFQDAYWRGVNDTFGSELPDRMKMGFNNFEIDAGESGHQLLLQLDTSSPELELDDIEGNGHENLHQEKSPPG